MSGQRVVQKNSFMPLLRRRQRLKCRDAASASFEHSAIMRDEARAIGLVK